MMKNKKYVKINWESNELSYAGEKDFQKWKNGVDKQTKQLVKESEGFDEENPGFGYTKRKVGCGFEHYNDDGDCGSVDGISYLELT